MSSHRVVVLLDVVAAAGVRAWLDGGWGVDALLGDQHREHDDLDLVVPLEQVGEVRAALRPWGFSVAEDRLPTRLVLRTADGEQVDLHPVTFDSNGRGSQSQAAPDGTDCVYPAEQFTHGVVGGRTVACVGPLTQLAHHSGYRPTPRDVDDMRRLTSQFGLATPAGYPPAHRCG
jgi:lincosamide nucleotidyltransferase A/C/D/E